MRDLLTIVAGLLILVLAAALAVPPFVDWREHRQFVDGAITRAAGTEVTTEGAIDIRILPTPRVRIERLRLGSAEPGAASLDAQFVRSEISLTALLHGEVRFHNSRIGRMEIKLPTGAGGDWRAPRALVEDDILKRAWVFEDLRVLQLFLTTTDPRTGRTDQVFAEAVHMQAQSLAGPWRVEGQAGGTPFSVATGEIGQALTSNIKIAAGGDTQKRVSFDGRMRLEPGSDDTVVPRFEGAARFTAGPRDGSPWPITMNAALKASGQEATLENVVLEAGDSGAALRLAGVGRVGFDQPRLVLELEGRRMDLDQALGGEAGERFAAWRPSVELPVEIALKLDSVTYKGEELSGLNARVSLRGEQLRLERLDVTAPGQTQITASGDIALGPGADASGRVRLSSQSADRFAAYLSSLGLGAVPFGDLIEARPLQASADIVAAHPVTSLRNMRVELGEAVLTGALRYTAPEGDGRGRLDAQLALQGLDLNRLPILSGLTQTARGLDLGLVLDARGVGYGAGERAGRIAARIVSEGASLAIERLEIADLAGANATLQGRITPDGRGRIGGRLDARRAAPLVDLVGRFWLGGLVDLVPAFLREGALDTGVLVEQAPATAGGAAPALVTKLSGTASGGGLEVEIQASGGRTRSVVASLSTERVGNWFGMADRPTLARPGRLRVGGGRDGAGRLALDVAGEIGGLRVATPKPLLLNAAEDGFESGETELRSDDLTPFLAAFGQPVTGPVPVAVFGRLARVAGVPRVELAGRVAGSNVEAELFGTSRSDLSGTVSLGRLSLPWLASALALPSPPAPAGTVWPTGRFGPAPPPLLGGTVSVTTASLDLGRGLVAGSARFDLATVQDGFTIRDFEADLLGGQVKGSATISRQGGLGAVIAEGTLANLSLPQLAGQPFMLGRLNAELKVGGSGESVAGIVANLGGAGSLEVASLAVSGADPGAAERAASRALRSDDPLAQGALSGLAAAELDQGPFLSPKAAGQASLVSGSLRIAPLVAEAAGGIWQGSAGIDFRTLTLDLRGSLTARDLPRRWTGAAPYLGLGWAGPVGRPTRTIDVGPLGNGLASVVLSRELERIEIFELDAAERGRINARVEMDRARKAAAEEAARQARLEAERARETERARLEAERLLGGPRPPDVGGELRLPPPGPPLPDTRPPAAGRAATGG
ncbi:MAG: hypothetical protein JWR08_1196 [Enterovirga sp.]|nr:hypothetical protein [Enterovirga sp.]